MTVTHVIYLAEKPGRHVFGGTENHIWQLLPALARLGTQVDLIVLGWHPGPLIRTRCQHLERTGVHVTLIERQPFRSWLGKVWSSLRCLHECRVALSGRRDHVLHFHLDAVYVPTLAWLARCKHVVFSFHNDEPWYRERKWRLWFRVVTHMVSHFVAITEHVKDYCSKHLGIDRSKITVVRYGVEPLRTTPYGRNRFGLTDDDWVVGFLGRFVEQKNLFLLLEALARLPEAKGILIGGGALAGKLSDFIRSKNIANVQLCPPVPDGPAAIRTFDVLCLPSRWEGLGLVLIEAMLSRVSIVATRTAAIPEVLGNGAYGFLCEPDSVEELVAALRRCRAEPDEASRRVAAAFEYAKSQFSVDQMTRGTLAVYERVVARKQARLRE